jgi:hypothetical protein
MALAFYRRHGRDCKAEHPEELSRGLNPDLGAGESSAPPFVQPAAHSFAGRPADESSGKSSDDATRQTPIARIRWISAVAWRAKKIG